MTPWYLNPAIRADLLAKHTVNGSQQADGGWLYAVADTAHSRAVKAAWQAAYEARDPSITVQPDFLMAALSGVSPYEWSQYYRAADVAAAAMQLRLAAGERLAA